MNPKRIIAAAILVLFAAASAQAVVTQTPYQINVGGTYTYKPSPWTGIPGGVPSDFQLDFGIGGTFTYELDTVGPTARLLDLNLVLSGNEAIQAAAPDFHVVTSDRVETWLAGHTFVTDFIGGLLHLKSSTTSGLKLTDGLNGNMGISGGFDGTPVDGTAMLFQFSASAVPEPASAALITLAAAALLRKRR
jgi:hypothetical protein